MARSFNGSSDYIQLPFAGWTAINGGSAMSMSCWFKGSAAQSCIRLQTNSYAILFYSGASGPTGSSQHCVLAWDGTATGGLAWTGSGSPASPQDSNWHHLAMSWQQNVLFAIYTDGALTASRVAANVVIDTFTSTGFAALGVYGGGPSEYVSGVIADAAVWTAALTAGEIAGLARGARPFQIRRGSLVSYYPLTGIQSPEPDLSGLANNGTVVGTINAFGPPVMQFTPRWPQVVVAGTGPPPPTTVFRRTLSALGTRTGSRQAVAS